MAFIEMDFATGGGGGSIGQLTYEEASRTTTSNKAFTETCTKKPLYVIRSAYYSVNAGLRQIDIYDVEHDICTQINASGIEINTNISKVSDTEWNFNVGSSSTTYHTVVFAFAE